MVYLRGGLLLGDPETKLSDDIMDEAVEFPDELLHCSEIRRGADDFFMEPFLWMRF